MDLDSFIEWLERYTIDFIKSNDDDYELGYKEGVRSMAILALNRLETMK